MWLHLGMMKCHVPVLGSLWPWPHFKNTRGRSISPILFGVGIPNFVYGCIFVWGYVAYRYGVTVTLTYDLVSRIVVSPILFEVGITNLVFGLFLGWRIGAYHFVVTFTLTLTSDLFLSPHFFKKASGILQSPPSVRPSVHPSRYLLLNHWTKSNQIWCVSYSHESGAQRHIFSPAPWGPGEGPKVQISLNIIKFQ